MSLAIHNLTNANVAADAAIKATKLEHEHVFHASQTGTVVAGTYYFGPIRGTNGTVVSVEASITETVANDASRHVTVDLKKSTGAGSFSSILSAVLDLTSATTLRATNTGSISSSALVDGDLLQVVVAVSGSGGNQALGLVVRVTVREDASP